MFVAAFALSLSQVIVTLTHTPASPDAVWETAIHGHAHGDQVRGALSGHDATDHEHQLVALPAQSDKEALPSSDRAAGFGDLDLEGLVRDGPRRPPRPV